MDNEDRPDAVGGPHDSRYYGPFGPPPGADALTGWEQNRWPAPDDYRPADRVPQAPQPGLALGPVQPPEAPPPPAAARARSRPLLVVLVAALTALLVGGAAGYAGSRLAGPAAPATSSPTTAGGPTPGPAITRTPVPPAPDRLDTVAVARQVLPGTVMIQVGGATGSGFVIDRDGRIVTNNHVVAGAADGTRIRVEFHDGRRRTATLVGRSPSYDIAVIKVRGSADLRPLGLGDSQDTEVGQAVIAIGSPLGLGGTVTQGIVSALNRPVVVNEDANADVPTAYIDALQTDAPINPGNSGGPLIDAGGRVIGVNSAILTLGSTRGQSGNIGLGFAIPINQASTIADELIRKGRATYPVIGATVQDASGGVELKTVEKSGPARKAGLRTGDTITGIDGQRVDAVEELIVTIRTHRPGEVVVLDYSRGSAKKQARVTLGSKEG